MEKSAAETAAPAPAAQAAAPRSALARIAALPSFGSVALGLFAVQLLTGLLLMVYYRPVADRAHYSMAILTDAVRFGWLVRSIHWWSSDLMIAATLAHLVRVYFAGAYRGTRRVAWVSGILLLVIVLAFAFTGALLPWDQRAYWSVEASRETIATIPLIGGALLNVFWGGWELGEEVLLRFYAFHVGVLPLFVVALLAVHLGVVAYAAINSAPAATGGRDRSLLALGLGLLIAILLLGGALLSLATLLAPPLLAPADPLTPLPEVAPRWYFLPAHRVLRHLSGGTAALAVVLTFVVLLLVPLLDRSRADSPRARLARWALGALAIVMVALAARRP